MCEVVDELNPLTNDFGGTTDLLYMSLQYKGIVHNWNSIKTSLHKYQDDTPESSLSPSAADAAAARTGSGKMI